MRGAHRKVRALVRAQPIINALFLSPKQACYLLRHTARLMELVDIRDLKSRGSKEPCRFESGSGHHPILTLELHAPRAPGQNNQLLPS